MLTEFLTETKRDWDRGETVGASEVGQCARRTSYLKHNTPEDDGYEDSWGMKERGHWVEAWAVKRLRENGAPVHEAGDDQVTYSDGFLSATPDGWFDDISFDVKSFDPRKSKLPEPMHILQARLGARLNPNTSQAMLIYINASDYEDQQEFGPWPKLSDDELASLKTRARDIMAKPADDHPREGYFTDECGRFNCPFYLRCIGEGITDKGRLTPEQEEELRTIQEQHVSVDAALNEAKEKKSRLQEQVRTIFQAANVKKMTKVASISRQTRGSLDTEAMERAGIDLAPFRRDGKPYDVITIRKTQGANAK